MLPKDAAERKSVPIATGVLDYFPDAIAAVAECSKRGNDQHNPGQPLHWARSKSTDEADALIRHFMERGTVDTDGIRHSAKVAWRALALLQKEIEDVQPCKQTADTCKQISFGGVTEYASDFQACFGGPRAYPGAYAGWTEGIAKSGYTDARSGYVRDIA